MGVEEISASFPGRADIENELFYVGVFCVGLLGSSKVIISLVGSKSVQISSDTELGISYIKK